MPRKKWWLPPHEDQKNGPGPFLAKGFDRKGPGPFFGGLSMSILIDRNTRVIVQGITGSAGRFHAGQMRAYGTQVVGGVTPGKGGTDVDGLPVFNSVAEAVAATRANCTVIYVPAPFAYDAILEAAAARLPLITVITEGMPTLDMVRAKRLLEGTGLRLIGPNGPGLVTPGQCKVGIMPNAIHTPGRIGLISRSGTLTYDAVWQLTQAGRCARR